MSSNTLSHSIRMGFLSYIERNCEGGNISFGDANFLGLFIMIDFEWFIEKKGYRGIPYITFCT